MFTIINKVFKQLSSRLLVVFMLGSPTLHAADIKPLKYDLDATGGWIPYDFTGDAQRPGIFSELIGSIMERAEIPLRPVQLPTRRAVKALEVGLLDFDFVSPDWFPNGDFGPSFVGSMPIIQVKEYLVTLPSQINQYQVLNDAYGEPVGTIAGYAYFDDDQFQRMDFGNEGDLVRALEKGRVQVAILEEMTAHHWARQLNIPLALGAVHSEGQMIMRLRAEHQSLLPRINAAIRELKNEGQIEAILDRYRVAPQGE